MEKKKSYEVKLEDIVLRRARGDDNMEDSTMVYFFHGILMNVLARR